MNWLDDSIVGWISALNGELFLMKNIVFFWGITNFLTRYFKDTQNTLFLLIWQKLLIFPYIFSLNHLLNLELINIHKMRGPNSYLVFSPKKNFQELQFHQKLTL